MRLSTKGRYAVMAMADLAKNGRGEGGEIRAVSLAEIAARQEISLSYLEQLFARLRKSELVKSVRGPGGGYRLAKAAHETVVAEIVLARYAFAAMDLLSFDDEGNYQRDGLSATA